uniref:Uncharacterized protein n=1 Tax=Arundo donax TaxID=35708 RepID=A0A0A9FV42_ARUDO
MPKSETLAKRFSSRRMFADLTSRWMIDFAKPV